MSPLLMDTGYETNSPSPMSAEEKHRNKTVLEKEGEGRQGECRGTKRQEKNRDAARKSRRKQTERADELHEELQNLERSNSTLRKEIASLKKELHSYTKALESHEPLCILKASKSSSTLYLSVSPSADSQTSSNPLQASSSSPAATPSLSTPSASTFDPQTLECVESSHISSSVPALTATLLDSATVSSAQLFTPSCAKAVPNSVTFSTAPSPHSLFSPTPPSLITSRLTKASSVCTNSISSPVNSSSVTTPVHPESGQDVIHESSSLSANACLSTQPHFTQIASQMKQASFQSPFSNATYSRFASENTGQPSQECPMNLPQLHQGNIKRNPSLTYSLSSPTLADPALQSLSVPSRRSQEPISASTFASSYSQHVTPNPTPLLSQLTNPSPLVPPQTTSVSLEGQLLEFSLQSDGDLSADLSLTEFLRVNDWILQDP
ncbi:uncharacterized protein batf2 [Halichoeres trimaculatus]|uniref:uncharacterized protein batf2 n=1 Tax=Halichoeres trimaculatus TaxID=147232 RepID=UPI003D9EE095